MLVKHILENHQRWLGSFEILKNVGGFEVANLEDREIWLWFFLFK